MQSSITKTSKNWWTLCFHLFPVGIFILSELIPSFNNMKYIALIFMIIIGVLQFLSYLFKSVVITHLLRQNYTPSIPSSLMFTFDVLWVAVLMWQHYLGIGMFFAISCAYSWTVFQQYQRVKIFVDRCIRPPKSQK